MGVFHSVCACVSEMIITKTWAMPNSKTFSIRPINSIIERYIGILETEREAYLPLCIVDPFARDSKFGTVRNDIDPQYDTEYHLDATEFLKLLPPSSADMVLYDPPYSSRQLTECYRKLELSVSADMTRSDYWTKQKNEIARIMKPSGICISFGWNSGGIGKSLGFEQIEIMLVAHGGHHNDTIVTVERKVS